MCPPVGTLNVRVAGSGFPRAIFGRFQLPCAIIRFFIASFSLLKEHQQSPFDIIFVDQISETIPLLKWSGAKVRTHPRPPYAPPLLFFTNQ
jgi:alpha-1,3/alpha-1,6-mannosyltransferase